MGEKTNRVAGAAAALSGVLALAGLGGGTTYASTTSTPTTHFVMASFNVLGASHTLNSKKYATYGPRMVGEVATLESHAVDVVGFQEIQAKQRAKFNALTENTWSMYPADSLRAIDGENSIAWRNDTWTLVSASTRPIPYFDGNIRNMPVVLLSNNLTHTQAYFANFHNPASNPAHGDQWTWRRKAINLEAALANELAPSGIPVFFTGDMNERYKVFCRITGKSTLVAPRGGTNVPGGPYGNGCDPADPWYVDWIFTSRHIAHDGYVEDKTPALLHLTDHPIIVSGLTINPRYYPLATPSS